MSRPHRPAQAFAAHTQCFPPALFLCTPPVQVRSLDWSAINGVSDSVNSLSTDLEDQKGTMARLAADLRTLQAAVGSSSPQQPLALAAPALNPGGAPGALAELDRKLSERISRLQAAVAHDSSAPGLSTAVTQLQQRVEAQGGRLSDLEASSAASVSDLHKRTADLTQRLTELHGVSSSVAQHASDIQYLTVATKSLQEGVSSLVAAVESCAAPGGMRAAHLQSSAAGHQAPAAAVSAASTRSD